jgi:hypothetical protein
LFGLVEYDLRLITASTTLSQRWNTLSWLVAVAVAVAINQVVVAVRVVF